jgi:primary-amine oxidase
MAQSKPHPLAQLSQDEFILARNCVLKHHGPETSLFFRSIQLQEPKKDDLVPFLIAEHDGSLNETTPRPARCAEVEYDIITDTRVYTRTIVDMDKGEVVSKDVLEQHAHPNMAT